MVKNVIEAPWDRILAPEFFVVDNPNEAGFEPSVGPTVAEEQFFAALDLKNDKLVVDRLPKITWFEAKQLHELIVPSLVMRYIPNVDQLIDDTLKFLRGESR
ncbi:MAG: hypothetical protein IPK52_19715 [Chloroflexi bacterium]|nr:hypothetical protein [Chloroflexota bacterium]